MFSRIPSGPNEDLFERSSHARRLSTVEKNKSNILAIYWILQLLYFGLSKKPGRDKLFSQGITLGPELEHKADHDTSTQSKNWTEIDVTTHPAFYTSEEGDVLYVTDTHSNRLRENGPRYSAVYRNSDSTEYEVVCRADSLSDLELEEVDDIEVEEIL